MESFDLLWRSSKKYKKTEKDRSMYTINRRGPCLHCSPSAGGWWAGGGLCTCGGGVYLYWWGTTEVEKQLFN